MSSIVPVSERPSRLFIEAFWTILEGIALLLKGTCILFAAIILNAGLLFAIVNNALFTPVLYSISALAEFYKLLFGTGECSVETSILNNIGAAICNIFYHSAISSQSSEPSHYGKPSANPAETTISGGRDMSRNTGKQRQRTTAGEPESPE
ncbi:uncharacterized protein RAG0_17043 [Rhynchosporium agropyri]|uniref:Uncharacterized protein n=2 Tax=Rhynchosporium TaxID=38037 RepID=A0A1E1MW97_RHYSE|nr:uncharacterized protein RAG0_17043 [Rhynchosporium agropyri]CZT53327.1 uncharacterized protein RSE6_14820 [Rhynchosporium secalis]